MSFFKNNFQNEDETITYEYGDNISCTVSSNINELVEIREIWNGFSKHAYSSWNYYNNLLGNDNSIEKPLAIIIRKKGVIVSIIAGYIKVLKKSLLNIGYIPLLKLKTRNFIVPIGFALGDFDDIDLGFMNHLMNKIIRKFNLDIVGFYFLELKNGLAKYLKYDHMEIDRHYKLNIASNRDLFEKKLSKYHRRTKTPEKHHFESVKIRCSKTNGEIEEFVKTAEQISKRSFKKHLGHNFIYSKEKKELYKETAENGDLYCYILDIDKIPCAFLIMYIYKNVCYFDQSGYDLAYRYCAPGSYILIKAMETVLNHQLADVIDFGPGENSFKKRLGANPEEVAHMFFYSNKIKAIIAKKFIKAIHNLKGRKGTEEKLQEKIKNIHKKVIFSYIAKKSKIP